MQTTQRLTRQDWILAALEAMAARGLSGIAVEPLAKQLGATKGSFYWHFRDRADLVTSALESWEKASTDAIIEALRPQADGRARLRQLLEALFLDRPLHGGAAPQGGEVGSRHFDISIALNAEHESETVAEVVARVTDRRVAYVAGELVRLGIPEEEARHRSLLAYTAYLGHAALSRSAPRTIPEGDAGERFVDSVLNLLLS